MGVTCSAWIKKKDYEQTRCEYVSLRGSCTLRHKGGGKYSARCQVRSAGQARYYPRKWIERTTLTGTSAEAVRKRADAWLFQAMKW